MKQNGINFLGYHVEYCFVNTETMVDICHQVKVGNEEFWYIATQAPMSHTVVDFWQMIWQHGVSVVAMLTGGISIDGQVQQQALW